MKHERIVILGGSGFVGTHLSARLLHEGHEVVVLTRKHHLSNPPSNIEAKKCDVHNTDMLTQALSGYTVVINLVGILNERGHSGRGFHQVHVDLGQKVVAACKANGIERLLHMSALNANANSGSSFYLRSKGEAEDAVHASGLRVTSFRPSVIFGEGDSFFNRFAQLMVIPGPFPLACADARFAPIWVEDVAACFATAIGKEETIGQRYDLCGPKEYSLLELVQYTANVSGRRKWLLPLGDTVSALQACVLEWFPGKPFSRDNFNSMKSPSICQGSFPAVFNVMPSTIESVVPNYLKKI